jgi:hypothetical protein
MNKNLLFCLPLVYYILGPECPFGLAELTLALVLTVDAIWSVFVLLHRSCHNPVSLANRLPLIEPVYTWLAANDYHWGCIDQLLRL